MRRAEYGFDAPGALLAFLAAAVVSTVAAVYVALDRERIVTPALVPAVWFWLNAASFFYTTRRGKFFVWDRILDGLALRGDERVLDAGCGRGAVLIAVAKRVPRGHVTGIDLWISRDQSGNASGVTQQNTAREGLGDRVTIETGDMKQLPFADGSFDLVVSSMAIHNITANAERTRAVSEAWRVLAPGGRLIIADIRATSRYAATLRALGAADVTRRRLGWRFWWGNPIAATHLVTATKPART